MQRCGGFCMGLIPIASRWRRVARYRGAFPARSGLRFLGVRLLTVKVESLEVLNDD